MIEITQELKANIATWVQALRSGEYQQTTGVLQDSRGYCCLGVACKLFIPNDLLQLNEDNTIGGTHPRYQHHAPDWLKEINFDFILKENSNHTLSTLNDAGASFLEIADRLEKAYLTTPLGEDAHDAPNCEMPSNRVLRENAYKRCGSCKEVKVLVEFYAKTNRYHTKSGEERMTKTYQSNCKDCNKAKQSEYAKRQKEKL